MCPQQVQTQGTGKTPSDFPSRLKAVRKEAAAFTDSAQITGPFGSIADFGGPSKIPVGTSLELDIPVWARAGVSMWTDVSVGRYLFDLFVALQDDHGQTLYESSSSVCLLPGMTVPMWGMCTHSHPQPGTYHLKAWLSVGIGSPPGKYLDLSEKTYDYMLTSDSEN